MKNRILSSVYMADAKKGIWSRPGYTGIAYSDGDEVEDRIAEVIEQAVDITVLSTELRQHCIDWPSLYHLSGTRANILRPFDASLRGDILEIGSGCGAITRYLGESGANVLALEGSSRRAAITRSRTRDLENVTVLAEKLDQFQSDCRFDVITLIGVLEYANLFTTSENAALAMLQHVRSLLKPEGTLIIAIENQLGLKYFAGAPEDHLGQPMYGIEGRYAANQPQTFGRAVLADLLEKAGFAVAEFLAPFPDYKLPVSILTTEGLSSKRFDGAALAWQSVSRDPQLPSSTNFSQELTWPEIFKNGLALEMANSFLIAASPLQQHVVESGILGYHYSTDRIPQFCKETIFTHTNKNTIVITYHRLGGHQCENEINRIINFECPDVAAYVEGLPLSLEFVKIVTRDGWSIEEVGAFIQRYIDLLSQIADQKGNSIATSRLADKLSGNFFDIVPQNVIIAHDGQPAVIDTEWSLIGGIEFGFLLFRSLLLALGSGVTFGKNSAGQTFSRRMFIKSALYAAGYSLTEEDLLRFIELESIIQQEVNGRASKESLNLWSEQMLPLSYMEARDKRVEFERVQSAVEQLRKERDAILKDKNLKIENLNLELSAVYSSNSWRITSPLRKLITIAPSIIGNSFRIKNRRHARQMIYSPDLVRNSVVKTQHEIAPVMANPVFRILLVAHYWPTRAHGGGLRILDIYTLIRQHCPAIQLDLYTHHRPAIDWSLDDAGPIFNNVYLSPEEDLTSEGLTKLRGSPLTYDVIDLQFHESGYQIDAFRRIGNKIIFTPMESLARVLFIDLSTKYRTHNSLRFSSLRLLKIATSLRLAAEEIDFAHKADEVVCVSRADAAFLRAATSLRHIRSVETGVSQYEFADALAPGFTTTRAVDRRCQVLYLAYFGSETNVIALHWYLEHVHPLIKSKVPGYVFTVIGRGSLSPFFRYSDDSIEFVGEVPEIGSHIKAARVGIAPALGGSGFRGKINQYAVLGLPCVVSPIAIKGLAYQNDVNIFVGETPEIFADRCIRLLTDLDLNDHMGQAARQLCIERYSWGTKWASIRRIYQLEGIQ